MLRRTAVSVANAVRPAGARTLAGQTEAAPIKTALYDLHVELGGQMVPFAGYSLPVQFPDGVLKSHLHVRGAGSSGLFDVSHMGQLRIHGPDRVKFVERLVTGEIAELKPGSATLSLITNEKGGIIDDTVITKYENYVAMVVNGATKHKDLAHMHAVAKGFNVTIEHLEDRQLVALQGPGAAAALQKLVKVDLSTLGFMNGRDMKVDDMDCTVTRCGYTGEDGFEIAVSWNRARDLATRLLAQPGVAPAGLGARDSLRLEAGLCLYGHDIDETITPAEAALVWTIGARRREEASFIGADVIMKQIKNKAVTKKRVGLVVEGAPAREGAAILAADGVTQIGTITSGGPSPCLKTNVAMGYVPNDLKIGAHLKVRVRNKVSNAVLTKMPFVPHNYYRGVAK